MLFSLSLLALAGLASAAIVEHDWELTWVNAAPDGFTRPVIGINGAWPCPVLEATVGDTVIIHLTNSLGNETTGMHFHGIDQRGTPEMDGAVAATQCSQPPGSCVTYAWFADAPGTYWYHSHEVGQYPDGFRGPLIIHDRHDPYTGEIDVEILLTCSDWYHSQSIPLVQATLSPNNTRFIPPIPDSFLLNEGVGNKFPFIKGKTYRFRIINFSALAACMVTFEPHIMRIIMQDGSYVTETPASQIRLAAAQRYDVLVTAKECEFKNYPFLFSMDINPDYHDPFLGFDFNQTGYLVMDPSLSTTAVDVVDIWDPLEESVLTNPYGDGPLSPVGTTITINFDFCFDKYHIPRACMNGHPYVPQPVPSLYTLVSTGDENGNAIVYGGANPYIAPANQVIELVVNNLHGAIHPFHLHGHQVQILEIAEPGAGKFSGNTSNFRRYPATKDVFNVYGRSYAVVRFRADNPGIWLFHCHIEWHVAMGMQTTIVEAPSKIRKYEIPEDFIDLCKIQGLPYEGNAAGNTENYTDTAGMLYVNSPIYTGALYLPAKEPDTD